MSKLGSLAAFVVPLVLLLSACGGLPGEAGDAVDADPTPAAAGDPSVAAEAFVAFAESGRAADDVPWAPTVRFSISGEQVAALDSSLAGRRESWLRCPGGATTYEGRRCPISPLTAVWSLTEHGRDVVLEDEKPGTVGCNRYAGPGVEAAATAWIRPEEKRRDCFGDFAIAVVVDDAGRIVALDYALSGP